MNVSRLKFQQVGLRRAERPRLSGSGQSAQSAFTLAEVMVSAFVLGVAAVSLYGAFGSGFMLVDSARQELRATQILTQKAEALRLCNWSSLTNFPISFVESYDPAGSASGTGGGTRYVGTVSTGVPSAIPNSAAYKSNLCLATITLNWTNYSGARTLAHSRTLQTMVARYGIQNYIWGTAP
jgi:prepilin-type N-terminal cleavage/methylation domain-containing protein